MVEEEGIGMAVGREKDKKEAKEGEGRIGTLLGDRIYSFVLSRSVMIMVSERTSFLNNVL